MLKKTYVHLKTEFIYLFERLVQIALTINEIKLNMETVSFLSLNACFCPIFNYSYNLKDKILLAKEVTKLKSCFIETFTSTK